jgi:hypothetical protein
MFVGMITVRRNMRGITVMEIQAEFGLGGLKMGKSLGSRHSNSLRRVK